MTDPAAGVRLMSDDPPWDDEPQQFLHIYPGGNGDYYVSHGGERPPMTGVRVRTSGSTDEFAMMLIAALYHHLRGNNEQAKNCARSVADGVFDRS